MFSQWIEYVYALAAGIPFDTLIWIVWGTYLAVFAVSLLAALVSARGRAADKRPFLCWTNAYAAVTAALFLMAGGVPQALFAAAVFWVAGYVLYGLLCALTKKERPSAAGRAAYRTLSIQPSAGMPQEIPAALPQQPVPAVPLRAAGGTPAGFSSVAPAPVQAAKSNVRLEHAVSVTEKLLGKNLGKSDRQELEKLKNTLAVLQIKGTLSPAEAEILNDNFNTLLKLMAKYNV